MNKRRIFAYLAAACLLILCWWFFKPQEQREEFPEKVRIAIRAVGNELLHSNQDSTSLVLPVEQLEPYRYRLSFEKEISIDPDSLVATVERSFRHYGLPSYYRVEVYQCVDQQVAYSYEILDMVERDIIPCGGRVLPPKCYNIAVRFTNTKKASVIPKIPMYLLWFLIIVFVVDVIYQLRKKTKQENKNETAHKSIGSFKFYPDQNKLVKEAIEIGLSRKECELLELFVAHPNEVIKRDELTKRVWEDNGVIVGRSLDTYISKLRKKLKDDDSIKLTNVHGVGYKLEVL